MSDITTQSLTSLVKNIKNKKLSSEEVTQAFVDRSEKSKELNAYITEDFSNAINKAKKFDQNPNLDLKLPGIPMAVKDLFCTENIRTTAGSKILENFIPTYESTVTQNIWNEGAILLGKLNCDEFAMGSSNETSFYGDVKNPWNKNYVPGGSSGGSAASVSARLIPCSTGTDTGGSIRQPASLTGICGIKPTYGRVSRFGMIAFASSLDQAGVFTRTAEDSAILLTHISGFDPKKWCRGRAFQYPEPLKLKRHPTCRAQLHHGTCLYWRILYQHARGSRRRTLLRTIRYPVALKCV